MIDHLKGSRKGEKIAILASGPTLNLFQNRSMPAIAVNGASLSSYSYEYFMCGDIRAPLMSYFKNSTLCKPQRIIASFLAPLDQLLYPNSEDRKQLRATLESSSREARRAASMVPLYGYVPQISPQRPHAFFQYHAVTFPQDLDAFLLGMEEKKFFHGGTITGVAMQMAWWMGAKEIHVFGCSMDNSDGNTYGIKGTSTGRTTDLQIKNLKSLIHILNSLGTSVLVHGPSNLKKERVCG